MKESIKQLHSQINKLEEILFTSNQNLDFLMNHQISFKTQLQEIIILNKSEIIAVKSASKIDFIPVNEIMYFSADLSYTEIVTVNHGKKYATKSINEYEEYLFNHPFFRISKSFLVNTKYIHSYDRRTGQILMRNRDLLDVARRRRTEFLTNIITI